MTAQTVVVLGGGIGGLTVASQLRLLSRPADCRVVVIERSETFAPCMSNLRIMTGERSDPTQGERALSRLSAREIEVVQGEVVAIDPATRSV